MAADRLALALPVDVSRMMDHSVTQTQLTNNTFQATPDDRDLLASYIEDAEGEFRAATDATFRESRAGVAGDRETYPTVTYSVPGHADFKRKYTGVSSMYDLEEVEKNLGDKRILPFDSAEGDEAYVYRGLGGSSSGDEWEDVTADYGDTWAIVDHRNGTVAFDPLELIRAMTGGGQGVGVNRSRLSKLRFAISYRHGTLGGSRNLAGSTALGTSLTTAATGSTAVVDASRLPSALTQGGSVTLLIGEEYVRATVDASADTIDIVERGVRGTTAATHSSGDRVQFTPPSVRKAVASRAGMQLIQSGRYSAFMPDSEDAIDKDAMLSNLKETWEATVAAARADA